MLETPTVGRYYREDRFIVFEPPIEYMGLVYACVYGGPLATLYGVFTQSLWFVWVGAAVCLSGLWANLSVVRIRFDVRNRTYRRRQGPGLIPRLWQGSVDELDAIVVIAEPSATLAGSVNYYMVLHWKNGRAPLMVLEKETRYSAGDLRSGAQAMLIKANRVSQSLRIPLYDNSHFPSPCPVSVF